MKQQSRETPSTSGTPSSLARCGTKVGQKAQFLSVIVRVFFTLRGRILNQFRTIFEAFSALLSNYLTNNKCKYKK
jgi:hypothetical protein